MANVNINRNVSDVFYRYKMPRLIAKVEGKGNGIKTVIVNMPEIAKALSRPPTYPTKYFGCELGAQTQFDLKNDRFIVNGSHDGVKLQELLDGFIKKFVLCPECENPETNLNVLVKKGIIQMRCIACGHLADVDMRHKLTTFIIKNPPNVDPAAAPVVAPGKKATKKGKADKDAKEVVNGNGKASHDDKDSSPTPKVHDDDDDWGEDTSAAAVQARIEALSGAAKTMTFSEDLEKTQQERVNIFYTFVKQKKAANDLSGPEREKEIASEADRLDIKDEAPMVLAELLFDTNMVAQIKLYRSLFLRFTHENLRAQRYLLGGFEQLVGSVHTAALLPKVPHILKAFYDCDIIDESVIIEWDQKPSKKNVSREMATEMRAKASPFIKWLKEAEEESSGSDEDGSGDDVEVVYTERTVSNVPAKPASASNAAGGDDGDDIDIDAI